MSSPIGHHDGGGIYQSSRWPEVIPPLQDDSKSLVLGTKETPLITGGSCAGQTD